jgi:cellulose synthase/poly-beta-1,6-N-acetylglucosamine synthase-like glycosyltransferase
VITTLLSAAALAVSALLACFAIRRAVLLAAAALPPRLSDAGDLPSLALLVPAYNEEDTVERTLAAIDRLEYPRGRLWVILIDDGSDDLTGAQLARWAAGRPGAIARQLEQRAGRAAALNEGIGAAPPTELLAVCDADVRPRPDFLQRLVAPFGDESVGAVAGFLSPVGTGPVARYAAVESWVNQLVTSAGKDRLDLNPPTLGAAAYRRGALERAGGFDQGSGDDVRATVALTRHGWRTRFAPDAVAENPVASGWRQYWRQHVRWARDLFSLRRAGGRGDAVGLRLRAETWMLSLGYADRVALLAAVGLALAGGLPLWIPAAYLSLAAVEVAFAVTRAGAGRELPLFLAATAAFFPVDVLASLAASVAQLLGPPRRSPGPSGRIEQRLAGQSGGVDSR